MSAFRDYSPTLRELVFVESYGSKQICDEMLFTKRYGSGLVICPRCRKQTTFAYLEGRRSFGCRRCRFQISPLTGTIFEKSKTPLTVWYKVMYLLFTSQGKIPSTELARRFGFTQKTAWRIKDLCCKHLGIDKSVSYKFSSAQKPRPRRRVKGLKSDIM